MCLAWIKLGDGDNSKSRDRCKDYVDWQAASRKVFVWFDLNINISLPF